MGRQAAVADKTGGLGATAAARLGRGGRSGYPRWGILGSLVSCLVVAAGRHGLLLGSQPPGRVAPRRYRPEAGSHGGRFLRRRSPPLPRVRRRDADHRISPATVRDRSHPGPRPCQGARSPHRLLGHRHSFTIPGALALAGSLQPVKAHQTRYPLAPYALTVCDQLGVYARRAVRAPRLLVDATDLLRRARVLLRERQESRPPRITVC